MKFAPLGLLVALALAGCQEKAAAPQKANPDAKPGLAAKDGVLVLPAVKGNPGAAYFSIFNGNDTVATIAAVAIEGASKSEMHQSMSNSMTKLDTLDIKPTWTQRFYPGGRHVMVFDLGSELVAGGKTEMTLTFADGDKFSIPLEIKAPGAAMVDGH